jgi:hypothetical protein
LTLANRLAARCALEAAATFDRARHVPTTPVLGDIARAAADVGNNTASVTLDELCIRYFSNPTSSRTSKTRRADRSRLSMRVEIVVGAAKGAFSRLGQNTVSQLAHLSGRA